MINIRFSKAEEERKLRFLPPGTVQAGLLLMFLKITVIQNLIVPCLFQYFVLQIRKYTNEENSK